MTEASKPRPLVRFKTTEVVFAEAAPFQLTLSTPLRQMDVSIVLDVYILENEVHPDGHLGWWKFSRDMQPGLLTGTISIDDERGLSAELEGDAPIDGWRNPDHVLGDEALILIAVVRSNATNAIVGIDRIPAFPTRNALEAFRAAFDRDWSRPVYASTYFLLPKSSTVHVVAPNIFTRDAVGNLCLAVFRLLKQNGIGVRIYADEFEMAANDVIRHTSDLASSVGRDDQILYFYSTFDRTLDDLLGISCRRKTAYFHGVTAPELLQVFDPELAMTCRRALGQIPRLGSFDRLAANSEASATVLREAIGQPERAVAVIPPKLQPFELPAPREMAPAGSARLLYVGRIMSHKRVEDLLQFLAAYRVFDDGATLTIVGQPGRKAYGDYLSWLEHEKLGLPPGSVRWTGTLSDAALVDVLAEATAYLSMSEDEGFNLPLFEAMQAGVPILAFSVPAVRELVQTSGVLFLNKDHGYLAGQLHALLSQPKSLAALRLSARSRAESLAKDMHGELFFRLIDPTA